MKTKIIKSKGYYKLIVNDEQVNSYHKSSEPILLGCLSNYANSKNWTLSDFRLSEHLLPSPYLSNSLEEYIANDEEEYLSILSQLRNYRTSDRPLHLLWNTYNTIVLDDADNQPSLSGLNFPEWAFFTYKKGFEKLIEMKNYWENVNEKFISAEHLIENKHRQPSSSHFSFEHFRKERNI